MAVLLRSAISVITVYLYNELGGSYIFDQDKRGRWTAVSDIERDTLKRNRPLHANGILASQAAPGQSVSDYLETTPKETAKIGANVLSNMGIAVGALNPGVGLGMAVSAW